MKTYSQIYVDVNRLDYRTDIQRIEIFRTKRMYTPYKLGYVIRAVYLYAHVTLGAHDVTCGRHTYRSLVTHATIVYLLTCIHTLFSLSTLSM